MNTHDIDIELPPLPTIPVAVTPWKHSESVVVKLLQDYARAAIEADRKRQGEVVVTKTPEGEIVAATRQDDEGKILKVIAESERKELIDSVIKGNEMNTHDIDTGLSHVAFCRVSDVDPHESHHRQLGVSADTRLYTEDQVRAAIEVHRKRIAELEAARIAYASEFAPDEDGNPDVGSIHENIRKLKAALQSQDKAEPSEWLRQHEVLMHRVSKAALVVGYGGTINDATAEQALENAEKALLDHALALQSQHETQLQVWRSTDSCGEFWSWDEADQYDYDRALPENRRVILIIKEGDSKK